MKEKIYISDLTLELYNLGEATIKEQKAIEAALLTDDNLRLRLEKLKKSDEYLNRLYSLDKPSTPQIKTFPVKKKHISNTRKIIYSFAAALILGISITFIIFLKGRNTVNEINSQTITEIIEPVEQEDLIETPNTERIVNTPIQPETPSEQRTTEQRTQPNNSRNPLDNVEPIYITEVPSEGAMRGTTQQPVITDSNLQPNITIPPGLTTIFENMFADQNLTFVIIPERITSIGNNAFTGNPLVSVTIGSNVEISETAFPGNFASAYANYGKTAGTYIRSDTSVSDWIKQ